MNELPFVSVIIPCRNEKKFIGLVLDNLIAQDYPRNLTEVIVMDGMSEDGSRNVISDFANQFSFIKCLDNPQLIVPPALNNAIRISKGSVIIRLDAHASYPPDYISKLV